MTAIATLTLNPALDVSTATPEVRPTDKLRCTPPRRDPGGGGINVARVIHALGGSVTAVFPSGGPAGATIEALLADAGVMTHSVPIAGDTRESVTVDEQASGAQYRFVMPGPELQPAELAAVLDSLVALPGAPRYWVASGSLPAGVDPGIYRRVAALARARGARLILDTSGPALAASAGAGAFLVKPSLRELADRIGAAIDTEVAEAAAARSLLDDGTAEHVVLSLGERGALLVSATQTVRFAALDVPAVSAVGAGDSMVGAITLALSEGARVEDAVRLGIAAGAAALMTPATALVRRADVERLAGVAQG